MRSLKVLVVVMGVLLVLGVIALGLAVADRIKHPRSAPVAAAVAAPTASTLDLPAGARVVGAEASGDRLVVRVDLAGGSEELIVVNLTSGAPISTVILRPRTGSPVHEASP
ncbi:MAG TPA: hypothetical protein VKV32_12120 [Stellaceae bacterium]|nr:hypothetical protein [Stellaceae bacterium]